MLWRSWSLFLLVFTRRNAGRADECCRAQAPADPLAPFPRLPLPIRDLRPVLIMCGLGCFETFLTRWRRPVAIALRNCDAVRLRTAPCSSTCKIVLSIFQHPCYFCASPTPFIPSLALSCLKNNKLAETGSVACRSYDSALRRSPSKKARTTPASSSFSSASLSPTPPPQATKQTLAKSPRAPPAAIPRCFLLRRLKNSFT